LSKETDKIFLRTLEREKGGALKRENRIREDEQPTTNR